MKHPSELISIFVFNWPCNYWSDRSTTSYGRVLLILTKYNYAITIQVQTRGDY